MASNLASQGGSLECVILHPLSSPSQVGMEDMTPSVDNHGISSYDLNRINCAFASEDLQSNAISWIGIDFALFDSVKQNNHCWITNAAGTNALPIAMSVLAAILAFNRGLVHWVQATTKQVWPNRQLFPRRKDLVGQTLLIFGFGAIGRQLGMLAKGIGMKVVGVKRSRPVGGGIDLECCDELIHPNQLSTAVQQADVVVITAPLTSSTRNLFNAEMLNLLKDGVIFCNVGRGGKTVVSNMNSLIKI